MRWIFLLALLIAAPALGQPVARPANGEPCTYTACALRIEQGFFSTRIVRGPTEAPESVGRMTLFGGGLIDAVSDSPEALSHARSARSNLLGGAALALVGTVVYSVGITSYDIDENARLGLAIGGAGLAIGSGILITAAQREQSRAVWTYNRGLTD